MTTTSCCPKASGTTSGRANASREGTTADQAITISPTLEMLPVYARGGTVIPEAPLTQSTSEKPQGPLTLRVYPDANHGCAGTIYDDDGTSYAFDHDGFLRMDVTCTPSAAGMTLRYSAHQGSYPAWWSTLYVELYGLNGQPTVPAKGKSLAVAQPPARSAWVVTTPDNARGGEVSVQFKQ